MKVGVRIKELQVITQTLEGGPGMKEKKLIVLSEGVSPAEVAAMSSCCKAGPSRLR